MRFRFSSDVAILPRVAPPLLWGASWTPAAGQALFRVGALRAPCWASDMARGALIWNLFDVGASLQRFAGVLPL
jgi:hypothetical protein